MRRERFRINVAVALKIILVVILILHAWKIIMSSSSISVEPQNLEHYEADLCVLRTVWFGHLFMCISPHECMRYSLLLLLCTDDDYPALQEILVSISSISFILNLLCITKCYSDNQSAIIQRIPVLSFVVFFVCICRWFYVHPVVSSNILLQLEKACDLSTWVFLKL